MRGTTGRKQKSKSIVLTEAEYKKVLATAKRAVAKKSVDTAILVFAMALFDECPKISRDTVAKVVLRSTRYFEYTEPYGELAKETKLKLEDLRGFLKENHCFEPFYALENGKPYPVGGEN